MKIKIKNHKLEYHLIYHKRLDENKIKHPSYKIYPKVNILKNGKWIPCSLYLLRNSNKKMVEISAKYFKNGESELGKVDKRGVYKTLKISKWTKLQIAVYCKLYSFKIQILKTIDRLKTIRKKNLYFILLAFLLASIYFFINLYWDNYLQNLINKSNFIQSIIVFLSISSIINIFYPFTFRRELSKKDVDEISEIKTKNALKGLQREKYLKRRTSSTK